MKCGTHALNVRRRKEAKIAVQAHALRMSNAANYVLEEKHIPTEENVVRSVGGQEDRKWSSHGSKIVKMGKQTVA